MILAKCPSEREAQLADLKPNRWLNDKAVNLSKERDFDRLRGSFEELSAHSFNWAWRCD